MPEIEFLYYKKIRTVWDDKKQKRYYCLNDVIKTITNINDPKNHLKDMRRRIPALKNNWNRIVRTIEIETPGGVQPIKFVTYRSLMRVIKHLRSTHKVILFKRWLKRLES